MAGIGAMTEGAMPPERPQMQDGPPAQPEGGDQEANVTPEEQAQYDQFMNNALEVIYPGGEQGVEVSPNVLKGLGATPEKPIMALATTAVSMVVGLRDSAEQAGQTIEPDVMFHAGADLVAELAEVAEAAKIHEFTEEEIEQGFYLALDMYRAEAEKSGKLDKEAMTQGWQQVVDADKQGTLADQMPGIGERMKEAG